MKKKIDNNTNEENSKNAKKIIRRNLRLEARVTEKEYFQATELAKTCGLSISDYIRRTALGQHPRQRLSEDRKSTRLNSSHQPQSRMPSSA